MKQKKHGNHKVILAILFIVIGIAIGLSLTPKEAKEIRQIISLESETQVTMNILAIDNANHGVFSKLVTKVRPGNGLVLLNINNVLADYYSQNSARVAAKVAANYTNISLENIDISYSIEANATAVEGSSAGSAMAIATIAALQNKQLNPYVVITGSINEDGSFGTVGAVRQKAKAAKEAGASIMLVPAGSLRLESNYNEDVKCTEINSIRYCEIKYVPDLADTQNTLGIKVIEVDNVGQALQYFYQPAN